MTQELKNNKKENLFQSLVLNFDKNGGVPLNTGNFFESSTENNKLYLIHQIQNFAINKESDTLEVQYICEQLDNDLRNEFLENERISLLNPADKYLISMDISLQEIADKGLTGRDFLNNLNYQLEEFEDGTDRTLAFVIKEIENIQLVVEDNQEKARVLFVVDLLLPIHEKEKDEIKAILYKTKFKIISQ